MGINASSLADMCCSDETKKDTKDILPTRETSELPGGTVAAHLKVFSYSDLSFATGEFSTENWRGEDVFGATYRGFVLDPTVPDQKQGLDEVRVAVVVRKLKQNKAKELKDLEKAAETLASVRQAGLLTVFGIAEETGEVYFVSEVGANGLLESKMYKVEVAMTWNERVAVLKDVATGLACLHGQSMPHHHIVPSSVYLTEENRAKLADSVYADLKTLDGEYLFAQDDVHAELARKGYLDPVVKSSGTYDLSSDIYSFGMLILEVLTGLHCVNEKGDSFLPWIHAYWNQKNPNLKNLVDPKTGKYPSQGALKLLTLSKHCVKSAPAERPSINDVIEQLKAVDLNPLRASSKRVA